ncbi:MAG: hypothetical protein ACREJU_07585 [Nitrospiraceae bacterium]
MTVESQIVIEFHEQLRRSRERDADSWRLSRQLVGPSSIRSTLKRLTDAIHASSLPASLRDGLLHSLDSGGDLIQTLPGEDSLKRLTGLPPTKAIRALCVFFGLTAAPRRSGPISRLSPVDIERALRAQPNPFDVLLQADVASALDLGAGDLSFAEELVEHYLPALRQQGKALTLHCVDRIQPGSQLGGPLQADPRLVERLQKHSPGLHFRFWGNQDMFDLDMVEGKWPRYTIASCYAPATPTFAYEPTRISPLLIDQHLRKTKGEFQAVRFQGEDALEVRHAGRALLFPRWKFEIRGPLALLDLLSRSGQLCILASVDSQVFWEILSQLLADPALRPRDIIFERSLIPDLFGPLYTRLSGLPIGGSLVLSDRAELRPAIPRVLGQQGSPYRFRYAEVRRGAEFKGIPCSRTARFFRTMTEEDPPWLLILLPDEGASLTL